MSDYTHLNLKDAEDQAPNFGLGEHLEFRMARAPLGLEHSGLSYLKVAPGFRFPLVRELKQWDAVRVHKDTMRSMEAGEEGAEFLIVGAPNTGPGDADMVQGWWSD